MSHLGKSGGCFSAQALSGRKALVTGAGRGIGRAAALSLAASGAELVLLGRTRANLEQVQTLIESEGGQAVVYVLDISRIEKLEHELVSVKRDCGDIDILINNAGITRDASLVKMDVQQWQQVLDVNLTGVFNATKSVSDYMIKQKYGRIISTSSVVAHNGNFGQTNYAATKGGVISFSKSLAKELGKYNITVNAVAPGFVETDIIKTIPDHVLQMIIFRVPLGRAGKPEDVAKAYAFLASDDAAYISGTVINVDGGLTF